MIAPIRSRGEILRFGTFEFDTATGELRREGRLIHLRHQPGQILRLLLEKPGALITRMEMISSLWPDDLDVDVEQGLNHCVKEIRAALGDRASAPRFIQTFPRRGYRFLAEVRVDRPRTPQPERTTEAVGMKVSAIPETAPLMAAAAAPADPGPRATPEPGLQGEVTHGDKRTTDSPRAAVRVRVVLSRIHDGVILWTENYDRPPTESEQLARDVASGVKAGLTTALTPTPAEPEPARDEANDELGFDPRFE